MENLLIFFSLIAILAALFFIYKFKNANNNKSKQEIVVPNDSQNSFKDDEKASIVKYFEILNRYLDGFFLRKYILSLISIKLSDMEKLKNKYEDINSREVKFPISYFDISNKNDLLYEFLTKKYNENLPDLNNNLSSKELIEEIKDDMIRKKHFQILNELKNYIDQDDIKNWDQLLSLEPVAIVN